MNKNDDIGDKPDPSLNRFEALIMRMDELARKINHLVERMDDQATRTDEQAQRLDDLLEQFDYQIYRIAGVEKREIDMRQRLWEVENPHQPVPHETKEKIDKFLAREHKAGAIWVPFVAVRGYLDISKSHWTAIQHDLLLGYPEEYAIRRRPGDRRIKEVRQISPGNC